MTALGENAALSHDYIPADHNSNPREPFNQPAALLRKMNGSSSNDRSTNAPHDYGTNGVKTEYQYIEPVPRGNNEAPIKNEGDGSLDVPALKERRQDHTYIKPDLDEGLRIASHQTGFIDRIPSSPKQTGLAPLIILGPQRRADGPQTAVASERTHIVASKREESPEINLHSVPVFSPRPLQPNSSIVTDVFGSNRPPRRRHESELNRRPRELVVEADKANITSPIVSPIPRPATGPRTISSPSHLRSPSLSNGVEPKVTSSKNQSSPRSEQTKPQFPRNTNGAILSPQLNTLPLPPLSLPTYLQLELSSHRPSQSLIYRTSSSDFPYESSRVKIERLFNFLFLPHQLEAVLWFGTLACLDYWLYTFTILPLRLFKSLYILGKSWINNLLVEARYVGRFTFKGLQRMWRRRNSRAAPQTRNKNARTSSESKFIEEKLVRGRSRSTRHHRRTKSVPSTLLPDDKADILKGLLMIFTCLVLLRLDASRMYHWVRGQAAIKLYVIYNVLEVCDRLLSAIGQDVLECLFSQEALERKPDGHSKVLRPFWLFVVALSYTVIHSVALFYQVITLNVAVNSYSNALVTLLLSNQFVEIKGTVFKKFEKENLFQLTCADIVERFQLWHMLLIIALRNIVETGGFSMGSSALSNPSATAASSAFASNFTHTAPRTVSSILPSSFTFLPTLASSLSAYIPTISQVLSPFFIVLGSEMLIDWLKHAYINKFNNVRPIIYGRFLDVLAKDYYTNAFGNQNLTKRLGLPVIPLSCLLIRACVQTYYMFVAAWTPPPPSSAAASLASIHQQYTASRGAMPTSTAAIIASRVDDLLYHIPSSIANSDISTYFTTVLIILLIYLVLLACKLILGMLLLVYSRARLKSMRAREHEKNAGHHVEGARRVGGWGVVEVGDDKRRFIYEDDASGLKGLREREVRDQTKREQAKEKGGTDGLDKVNRYDMVAKRIW